MASTLTLELADALAAVEAARIALDAAIARYRKLERAAREEVDDIDQLPPIEAVPPRRRERVH